MALVSYESSSPSYITSKSLVLIPELKNVGLVSWLYTLLVISLLLSWTSCQPQYFTPPLSPHCYQSTNITGACIPVNNSLSSQRMSCLGAKIPFTHTSLALATDSASLKEVQEKLHLWTALRSVPQCWAIVQPFLCSVYLPKCTDTLGVTLPSKQKCERTRKPCQIVHDLNNGWPDFLQCDHPNFVSGCGPENYEYVSFNTSGRCEPPLVRTITPESYYPGVEGCGLPCENPLFSEAEHQKAHTFVAVFGSICLVCTFFTLLTFIIDWKNANRYPALIIFFINACFFLGCVGWMAQFAGDARTEIVCRKDGTVRRGEPQLGAKESMWCSVIFTVVYYFLIAGICWYVMLAYAWCLTFSALAGSKALAGDPGGANPREVLKPRTAYFHIISWCSPLVLTIVCLALSEIDGDSLSGICFVGVHNNGVRALFVLAPVGLVIVVGTFFLMKGVYTLTKIRNDAASLIPEKAFSKIRSTIVRLGIFTAVALAFVFITFAVHIYVFTNEEKWKESFRKYMLCKANMSVTAVGKDAEIECGIEDRPSLVTMQLHIFAFFGAGIAMSSWSWTRASLSSWERFFRWIFHKPSNKPVKLKRHRMIAQMFEKRKEINQGRMSISYRSSHDDPLGMKFDFNSGSDDELSSNFAMAMPQLVRRRGGVIFPKSSMGRRHSDSDVTSVVSTRRVSRESLVEFRDASFVIVDRDGLPAFALPEPGRRRRKKVMKTRKQRKRDKLSRLKPTSGPMFTGSRFGGVGKSSSRKGSDSSVLSQLSAASMRFFKFRRPRNSLDSESLNSNLAGTGPDGMNLTSQNSSMSAIPPIKPRPRLEFGPAKPKNKKNFGPLLSKKPGGIFNTRKDIEIEMGLIKSGTEEAASPTGCGVKDRLSLANMEETQLSGTPVNLEGNSGQKSNMRVIQQNWAGERNLRSKSDASEVSRNSSSTQGSSCEDEAEQLMWEQMQRQQQQQHQRQQQQQQQQQHLKHIPAPPSTAKTTTMSQHRVQHLRSVTVETHRQELHHKKQNGGDKNSTLTNLPNGANPPLEALMAEISCGNWGVLLGKSGSSSGSEVGGFSAAYTRNIPMGRPNQFVPPPPPAPANPNNFSGGGALPYHMSVGRNPYMGVASPQSYMPFSPSEPMLNNSYPYMGKRVYEMGGAYPTPSYPGMEGYPYGGSVYPPYPFPIGQGTNGLNSYPTTSPGYMNDMNNMFAQSYNMGSPVYPMNPTNVPMSGGARPKRNWSPMQAPYLPVNYIDPHHSGSSTGRQSQDRRFVRERQKERQMRRPNHIFQNSTYDMDDEEIDSISVVR